MLKLWNCYIPWQVFQLAELRAGASHIALLYIWFAHILMPAPLSPLGVVRNVVYGALMFFFQRRLASGLPVRYTSVKRWRTSPSNFRHTSRFLRSLREKAPSPPGSLLSGERPVAVLTGGERGIGFEVAQQLVRLGFDVLLCCPFPAEAECAILRIRRHAGHPTVQVSYLPLNLAEERSVRQCAESILAATQRIDLLVNNAGILSNSGPRRASARGDELVVAVNFLGPVLLTELLLGRIQAGGGGLSRIVNVSSLMELNANVPAGHTPLTVLQEHCRPQPRFYAPNYSLSKLLLVCYTRDLARRLQGTATAAVTLHPGVVLTGIYDGWGAWSVAMRLVMRTVFRFAAEGAEVVLYSALADDVVSGAFYADCARHDGCVSPLALDEQQSRNITTFVCEHFGLSPANCL